MKATDLIVGKRYHLANHKTGAAVYEGRHTGALDLADGGQFLGADGALRFRLQDGSGRVLLLESGRDVVEPEDVRLEREAAAKAFDERCAKARSEAVALVESLGLEPLPDGERYFSTRRGRNPLTVEVSSGRLENVDEIEIRPVTIAALRHIIATLKA